MKKNKSSFCSRWGFEAKIEAKGVNWENVLCSRSLLEWVNSKNSMPVGGSSLVITNPIMGTKYKIKGWGSLMHPQVRLGAPKNSG